MTSEEKKKLEEQLDFLYNESKNEGGDIQEPGDLMANAEIFGVIDADDMDFDEEIKNSFYDSKETLESMAGFYLGDNASLAESNYTKNKVLNDAQNLSDMRFLQKIARRAVIKQMTHIQMGDATPRHYETLYMGMREMRENIKQSTTTMSTMEGFYKQMRADAGMEEKVGTVEATEINITTTNDLNNKLEVIMQNIEMKKKKMDEEGEK